MTVSSVFRKSRASTPNSELYDHDSGNESDGSTTSQESYGIMLMEEMQESNFQLRENVDTDLQYPSGHRPSKPEAQWKRQKSFGKWSAQIDELMKYKGLEEIKQQFLDIKSKTDLSRRQGRSSKERYHVVKSTVAHIYAKFLIEIGILKCADIQKTSGVELMIDGPRKTVKLVEGITDNGGGVMLVDEAYQLVNDQIGKRILHLLLKKMESHIDRFVVIFAGYKEEMESFLEHNPGLASRNSRTFNYPHFTESELWTIL